MAHAVTGNGIDASAPAGNPAHQAYQILHIAFTVAPIIAGLDKFFRYLVNWDQYLAPVVKNLLRGHGHEFMLIVGIVEVIAGLLVAIRPRIGGLLVALWLCAIIINLLLIPGYYDIALRDFGLALSAFSLSRLSIQHE